MKPTRSFNLHHKYKKTAGILRVEALKKGMKESNLKSCPLTITFALQFETVCKLCVHITSEVAARKRDKDETHRVYQRVKRSAKSLEKMATLFRDRISCKLTTKVPPSHVAH